jgi:tetratricopeptide (TPR) repeat protein
VLLYELLTGLKPFDTTELLKEGIDEIRRVIREQEPVRPSTRLSRLNSADLTTVAQRRRSEPPKLIRTISGDMDWIVMKALEKDRARRYETASGLALDVKRFLDQEAVLARPPSKLYRFHKSVQRNKLLFLGIAIIATLLIASLIVVTASLAKERQTRREAEIAKQSAQTEATRSQQVTKFLEDMLKGVGPSAALGQDTTMLRQILDRTAERIGVEMTNQPAIEADLRSLIGTLYQQIGNYPQAGEMHRAALTIRRRLFGPESLQVAASLNDLGVDLMAGRRVSEAEGVVAEALAIRRRHLGDENSATATSLNDLGAVYRDQGRLIEGEALAREALRIRRKLREGENLDVADSLRNLCLILGSKGQWLEAERMAQDVLSMRQRLLDQNHPWVASALADLAWTKNGLGKSAEATALNREALTMRRKLLPGTHPDVALSLYSVGNSMRERGNMADAHSILTAALSIQRKLLSTDDPAVINTLHSLALTREAEGKWDEAEKWHREVVALWRQRAGTEDVQTLYALRELATSLEKQKKWSEAETLHREALALWSKQRGNDDPQTLYALNRLGVTLEAAGKLSEAEAVFRELLAGWRKRAGNEDPETLYANRKLARTFEAQGKRSDAVNLHREALTAWRKLRGNEDPQTLYTLGTLTAALEADGQSAEAEVMRSETLAFRRKGGENLTAETLRELKALVSDLNLKKRFREAEKILNDTLSSTFIQQPSSVDFLELRLQLLGRQERWREAVMDAALIVKHQPVEHEKYHNLAPLLIITGDQSAYKQLCQEMLRRFGAVTHNYAADRVAKSCLLLPNSDLDLLLVDKLTDIALAGSEGDMCMPLFQMCKGFSMLRLGNFEKAIEWTEKSLNSPFVHAHAHAYAILAMAHWHLGHKDEARAMLNKGNALAPPSASADSLAQAENKWFPRLMARIQLDEANALIGPGPPPEKSKEN